MAGIGFELKKLFHRRGLMGDAASLRLCRRDLRWSDAVGCTPAVRRADREQLVAGGPPRSAICSYA